MISGLAGDFLPSVLQYAGGVFAVYLLTHCFISLYNFTKPSSLPRFLRKEKGAWALVTGASDGIGFGLCEELAAYGFNLILHGRNKQKLEAVASKLTDEFPKIRTRTFVADATKPVQFDGLLEITKTVCLTVLVNNVGGNANLPYPFIYLQDRQNEDIDSSINFNISFATKITSALLPKLLSNEPSLILNIGSLSAIGSPKLTVYAGSKAYLEAFSRSLDAELVMQGKDVTVHSVLVGLVKSGLVKVDTGFFTPTSRVMAAAILKRIGGPLEIAPYWPHALQAFFVKLLPRRLRTWAFIKALKEAEVEWAKWV